MINKLPIHNEKSTSFTDITPSTTNFTYINTVVHNKLLNGISNTMFGPNEPVTKLQAIVVVSRLLPKIEQTKLEVKLPYNDINKFKWANNDLKKAYHYNVISESDQLFPKKKITKAELISLLYKASQV